MFNTLQNEMVLQARQGDMERERQRHALVTAAGMRMDPHMVCSTIVAFITAGVSRFVSSTSLVQTHERAAYQTQEG